MLTIPESVRIFVARDPVDFRKQFDGLSAIAVEELGVDPLQGHLLVFFNRRRDRIKLLVWQHTGYWLFHKRLECGTFEAFGDLGDAVSQRVEVDVRRLRLLLDGIDLKHSKFRRHFKEPLRRRSQRLDGGTCNSENEDSIRER